MESAKAESLFNEVLNNEFEYFKLNSKVVHVPEIDSLAEYFSRATIPAAPFVLSAGVTVVDVALFIQSNIQTARNITNPLYSKPYIDRLRQLATMIQTT